MTAQFIVLEGPDGSGTTKHSSLLAERLRSEGHDVLLTKEPTDGPVGKSVRTALSTGEVPPFGLQLMFTADRAWHVEQEILPALKEGKTVISDRYALSTIVYGAALGLDSPLLESLNKKFIQPDIQILLLPPFETCMERIGERPSKEIMEEQSLQKRVYDGYAAYASSNGLTIIDSSGSVEETAARISAAIAR